jgi:hypothetical protein
VLGCPVTDGQVLFTMPLLPCLGPERAEEGRGGLREGPTRSGVRWSFGSIGEEWRGMSLMGLELPERWDVEKVLAREEKKEAEEVGTWREPVGEWQREGAVGEGRTIIAMQNGGRSSPLASRQSRTDRVIYPTRPGWQGPSRSVASTRGMSTT